MSASKVRRVAIGLALAVSLGPVLCGSAVPAQQKKPAEKSETFTGNVVPLRDLLEKFGAQLDPDAAPHWLRRRAYRPRRRQRAGDTVADPDDGPVLRSARNRIDGRRFGTASNHVLIASTGRIMRRAGCRPGRFTLVLAEKFLDWH